METTTNNHRQCEQHCGKTADCYAGGKGSGDWAGYYCYDCQQALGFIVFNHYTASTTNTVQYFSEDGCLLGARQFANEKTAEEFAFHALGMCFQFSIVASTKVLFQDGTETEFEF